MLTENAIRVLERRYLRRDEDGRLIETPDQMFRRVAHAVAGAEVRHSGPRESERMAERFYQAMSNLEFLPNSPTLMNAGAELGQLAACFVLPIDDSLEGVFETLKQAALIHKSGGGTGFSFSRIRPKGDYVASSRGVASGPVPFLSIYHSATQAIKQGGTRRGANMAVLRMDHPDILDFVGAKRNPRRLTSFNISVAVDDSFMHAAIEERDYPLVNPRTRAQVGSLPAWKVFDAIASHAWRNGEPGLIFLDRMNEHNPTPHLGEYESTNPCGEQPLLPYESCNLGSINLSRMVVQQNGTWAVNYPHLGRTVDTAVRFLDDVIDVNHYPMSLIREVTTGNRKVGLGVMGFADMLIRLGIPYDSEEALAQAESVMSFIRSEARRVSAELAKERGEFPNFSGSIHDRSFGLPLRNATATTIAPAGTISIIAGCSSGIEPLYAPVHVRSALDGIDLLEVNLRFREVLQEEGLYSTELLQAVAERGTVSGIPEVPEHIRRLFASAHDISPEWHVRMQAAFQKHTDNAVSKTVNLPAGSSKRDVHHVYRLAYDLGCKGITVYRSSARHNQVLTHLRSCTSCVWEGIHTPPCAS